MLTTILGATTLLFASTTVWFFIRASQWQKVAQQGLEYLDAFINRSIQVEQSFHDKMFQLMKGMRHGDPGSLKLFDDINKARGDK